MNSKPVNETGNDVSSAELFAHLPNATSAFEVEYWDDFTSYIEFYNKVFESRNDKPLYPYRYGSY